MTCNASLEYLNEQILIFYHSHQNKYFFECSVLLLASGRNFVTWGSGVYEQTAFQFAFFSSDLKKLWGVYIN